jgi:cytochrome c553
MWKAVASLILFSSVSFAIAAESDEALTPDSIAIKRCSACHYVNGKAPGPEFPNIAGQYESYLLRALKLFKENKRESDAMQLVTSLHKEQELVILANHFANQKPAETPTIANPEQSLVARGQEIYTSERVYGLACIDCHGADAKGYTRKTPRTKANRAMPNLAGQQPGYLRARLSKYTGVVQPSGGMCAMRKAGKTLKDRDVDALVEFLSSK